MAFFMTVSFLITLLYYSSFMPVKMIFYSEEFLHTEQ